MAATKYQVLCRYYNASTNNPITNNSETEYKKAFAFYKTPSNKAEENIDMMIEGNNPNNVKTDMLFVYDGTKIIEPTDGYTNPSYKWPYMIIDTYKKVSFSPWFIAHTCGSLESALEKVKILISSIGIDNVKVIKIVPFDQFIKIQ